jgi:hypothetical protein
VADNRGKIQIRKKRAFLAKKKLFYDLVMVEIYRSLKRLLDVHPSLAIM